jgi:adenylate cyclase
VPPRRGRPAAGRARAAARRGRPGLRLGATTYTPLRGHEGGYAGADDRGYQFLLAYPAGSAGFTAFSLGQVLAGDFDPSIVRDRIVILGGMAESVKDEFQTPLTGAGPISGAALHGQTTSQLIRQALGETRPLRPVPWPVDAAWTGLWCLLGGLTVFRPRHHHHELRPATRKRTA